MRLVGGVAISACPAPSETGSTGQGPWHKLLPLPSLGSAAVALVQGWGQGDRMIKCPPWPRALQDLLSLKVPSPGERLPQAGRGGLVTR